MELGYARVSTTRQDLDRQIDALTAAGIAPGHVYVDKKSGATVDRPGLKALLDYCRGGDVIVVHTLDRLGRTVRDTLNLIHQLRERGVGVRNLADPIRVDSANPEDPMAQLAVVLLALFAQMERTYTLERAAHARAVATAKGRRVGRPSVVTESQLVHATQLRADGRTIAEITAATGLTRSTFYRHLPARGPNPSPRRRPPPTSSTGGHRPRLPGQIGVSQLRTPTRRPDGDPRSPRGDRDHVAAPRWRGHHRGPPLRDLPTPRPRHRRCCADCGDGPLITGQPPELGDHPAGPALNWLRQHGWRTDPDLLCPARAH